MLVETSSYNQYTKASPLAHAFRSSSNVKYHRIQQAGDQHPPSKSRPAAFWGPRHSCTVLLQLQHQKGRFSWSSVMWLDQSHHNNGNKMFLKIFRALQHLHMHVYTISAFLESTRKNCILVKDTVGIITTHGLRVWPTAWSYQCIPYDCLWKPHSDPRSPRAPHVFQVTVVRIRTVTHSNKCHNVVPFWKRIIPRRVSHEIRWHYCRLEDTPQTQHRQRGGMCVA